ncbi:MAG: PKD domain-containing protein [Actinobacteria bacterium]|nr:PKD domain-containing protein [Actinomycetota bacterium]
MTLVEVLLSIGLSTMIVVPLTMWGLLALAEEGRTHDVMQRATASAFIDTWFPKDVAGALDVTTSSPLDCSPTAPGTGRVVLAVRSGDDPLLRTAYVELSRTGPSGRVETTLVRRRCIDNGAMSSQRRLAAVVSGSSSARCIPATGPDACRRVEMTTTPVGSTHPLAVTATRRVDLDPVTGGATGNRPPRARITTDQTSVPKGGTVNFSGASSTDREGPIASWEWEFPGGQTGTGVATAWTFTRAGQYPVVLTVTDSSGATNTTFVTITVVNQVPVAAASSSPTSGDLSTTFSFDASASSDPDGHVVSYSWNFGSGATQTTTSPSITHRFPAGTTLGLRNVELIVTDDDGDSSSTTISLMLSGRPPTASITVTSDQQATDPGGGSPLIGEIGSAHPTVNVNLIPVANDPDVQDGHVTGWSWTVARSGTTVFTSSIDKPVMAVTASLGPGTYDVTLTVTDEDHQTATATRQFRVAPQAPAAPTWGGSGSWMVSWPAVTSAQSYTVVIEETDAWCAGGTVVTNHTYVVTGTSFNYPGTTTCGWAIKFQARVSVTVAGITSAPSPWKQR